MSEIEKLYENAEIEPDIDYICDIEPDGSRSCDRVEGYPEFTAEKQISLMICLINFETQVVINREPNQKITVEDIREVLAEITNKVWQSLTPEEKQQVKGILE